MEIRNGILRKLQPFYGRRIEEGLQLQHQDIGLLCIVILAQRCLLVILHDLVNGILGIIIGLAHTGGQKAAEKAVGQAVILVSKRNISKISGQHSLLQAELRASRKKHRHDNHACNA